MAQEIYSEATHPSVSATFVNVLRQTFEFRTLFANLELSPDKKLGAPGLAFETWDPPSKGKSAQLSTISLSFRHRNRHCFAGAAFGDPDRIARGLDCGWCLEPFLDDRDAGLVAIDSNHGNLPAAILSKE
jgi:hypothetical protein